MEEARAIRARIERNSSAGGRANVVGTLNKVAAGHASRELPGLGAHGLIRLLQDNGAQARRVRQHNRMFEKMAAEGAFDRLHALRRAAEVGGYSVPADPEWAEPGYRPFHPRADGRDDDRSQQEARDLTVAERDMPTRYVCAKKGVCSALRRAPFAASRQLRLNFRTLMRMFAQGYFCGGTVENLGGPPNVITRILRDRVPRHVQKSLCERPARCHPVLKAVFRVPDFKGQFEVTDRVLDIARGF
jgi:hypothetical protein